MRLAGIVFLAAAFSVPLGAQQITIRAGTLLDGKGGQVRNTTIVIEGSRIMKIDSSIKNATYDLSKLTVMPVALRPQDRPRGHGA
jgi:imidazolonepropionase-like amidohydrolase